MLTLERPYRWQDVMRAAAGGVAVHINRDHQLEALERRIEPSAIGRRQHRVACNGKQRFDLTLARRFDFLSERGGGKFPHHQRVARHARMASPDRARPCHRNGIDQRRREEQPALAVQLARGDVYERDQPGVQCAKALRRGTDATVKRRWPLHHAIRQPLDVTKSHPGLRRTSGAIKAR